MSKDLLVLKNVSKSYAGVRALDDVSMTVKRGQIHCLVGENGSGKSTLIKSVAGVVPINRGEIIINGRSYKHFRAIDAIREGVQVIYQDLSLFPHLSVAENISINQLVEEKRFFVNRSEIKNIAEKELARINVKIPAEELVENLSMANRQIVTIVRALTQDARLIIMDEPTTALTQSEIDSLFSIIHDLKQKDISIVFVSHKLSEVLSISEKVTVLRDGKKVGEFDTTDLDAEKLTYYMTGKRIDSTWREHQNDYQKKPALLELKKLTKKGHYKNISLSLSPGEILGITGLLGSGRTELALSLFGLNPPDAGEIYLEGARVEIDAPQTAVKLGISFLPEDRHNQGLFLNQTIEDNISVTILKSLLNRLGLLSRQKKKMTTELLADELRIKAPSLTDTVDSLSGGNQQRVVLAKWLATQPRIFILDGPTVGIDIASKAEIYKMIHNTAEKGIGIILISDEISEVLHNCDRILIMKEGQIIHTVDPKSANEDKVLALAR